MKVIIYYDRLTNGIIMTAIVVSCSAVALHADRYQTIDKRRNNNGHTINYLFFILTMGTIIQPETGGDNFDFVYAALVMQTEKRVI